MNAIAHCVEGLWIPERTPVTVALAGEALRRFAVHLPRAVADGSDREARAECLIAAWLAGTVMTAGTWLQHKLAHVLGGLGLPHAETHAILLPHVTRLQPRGAGDAGATGSRVRSARDDPAAALAAHAAWLPDSATAARRRFRPGQNSRRRRTGGAPCRSACRAASRPRTRRPLLTRRVLRSAHNRLPNRPPVAILRPTNHQKR